MVKSLIITVKNEEKNIDSLLKSILLQTKMPDEVIFVDAFSKDKTFEKIYKFCQKHSKFKIFQKKGNRSKGRNFGIKKSKGEIIVITDAGNIIDKNWFGKITEPFEKKDTDIVAGFYKPVTKNVFEKSLSTYTCVMEDKLTPDFLPSSRSIAFKKNAWQKVGRYPEKLDTCEDLVFARNLKEKGFNFFVQKKAVVYWQQKKNLSDAFKQFFSYAKGDGQAFYIRPQTPFLYLRYFAGFAIFGAAIYYRSIILGFVLLLLIFLYLIWAISKNYRYVKDLEAFFWLPVLQISSDIAVMIGMIYGFLKK